MEMTFVADILDPIFSGFQAIALDRGIRFDVVEESDLPEDAYLILKEDREERLDHILNKQNQKDPVY